MENGKIHNLFHLNFVIWNSKVTRIDASRGGKRADRGIQVIFRIYERCNHFSMLFELGLSSGFFGFK